MAAKPWEGCYATYRDVNDQPAAGALAYFYLAGTSTPLTVYEDDDLSTPLSQPVVASARGRFQPIYIPYLDDGYRVHVRDASGVEILDIDGIANPQPSSGGGGGGGGDVDPTAIFQTGDPFFTPRDGTRVGWVRSNGRTIGNPASGATERANDDAEPLFTFLWNNFTNDICAVSGGRGPSAASDWGANKNIATIDMRGRAPIGTDTMGNVAANRIQLSTTINTTNNSATATVGSSSGLAIGMFVVASTVPAGTTITAISGSTLTLSTNSGVTAGTTEPARFSFFRDAQIGGVSGGSATITQRREEVGVHTHTASSNSTGAHVHTGTTNNENANHSHGYTTPQNTAQFDRTLAGATGIALTGGASPAGNTDNQNASHQHTFTSDSAGAHSHTITVSDSASPSPMNIVQPSVLGTWYVKL